MEKKLYRSRDKKVIAGIAGGLGDYLDVDPVIIRIILVLITIFHGIGILVYIIMWIAVPEIPYVKPNVNAENTGEESSNNLKNESTASANLNMNSPQKSSSGGRIVFGVILIVVGSIFLLERFMPFFDFEFVFSIGLVILGLAMILNFFTKKENAK